MSINANALTRMKGLVWVIGAIAAVFTLISLAPVISHMG